MENTLGKAIGIVKDTFEVTLEKGKDTEQKTKLTVKFDFNTVDDTTIKSWLCGNRRIAFQAQLRQLTIEEIQALNGSVITAQNAGQKIKSASEQIQGLIAAGVPEALAKLMVSDPDKFRNVMSKVEI